MSTLSPRTPLDQLVEGHPARRRILAGLGIDPGHGDRRTLGQACAERGLDARSVLTTLLDAEDLPDPGALSLSELCDQIVERQHAPLDAELDRLGTLARRVALRRGDASPWLRDLSTTFGELADGVRTHLLKEEVMLFPAIRHLEAGRVADAPFGSHLRAPVELLEREHEEIGAALTRLRELSNGWIAPEDTCPSCEALLSGLADLERDIRQHIRQENEVLFPRALTQFGPAVG